MNAPGRTGAAPLLRSTSLLIRLRLRRLANLIAAGSQGRKKPGDKTRTGNPGKKSSKIVLYIAWPMMLFMFGAITANSVMNLHGALDPPGRVLMMRDGIGGKASIEHRPGAQEPAQQGVHIPLRAHAPK